MGLAGTEVALAARLIQKKMQSSHDEA